MTVLNQSPTRVIRSSYFVRVRRDGKAAPIPEEADTPRAAKELGEAKARAFNLPLFYLDYRQDFDAQRDDGIYVVEVQTISEGIPI
jgi:hypothetical protein